MGKYVQATRFRVKEGKLAEAEEEIQRWMKGYDDVGAEASVYVQVGGTTGEAMISVEFPDGETWLKVLDDPRLLEARRRMTEASWPFEHLTTSVWQHLTTED